MKRSLLLFFCIIVLAPTIKAQVEDGPALDSFVIRFDSDTSRYYSADASSTPLWQIGRTHKTFFTTDTTTSAIMTDTFNFYPVNANNWFVIKVPRRINTLVSFWHRYQTDTGKDGGVVEYSLNHGLTWDNITDSCNVDSGTTMGGPYGILTSNFYAPNDTLLTGEPSFNGVSIGTKLSKIQFKDPPPAKTTSGWPCYWWGVDTFYIRFRFISDTTSNSLAGWFIDSIKVKHFFSGGGSVNQVATTSALKVSPNPSHTGTFTFPPLKNENQFSLEVYNTLGQRIIQTPYTHSLNITNFPKGLYFYRATDGTEYYSGRLLYE